MNVVVCGWFPWPLPMAGWDSYSAEVLGMGLLDFSKQEKQETLSHFCWQDQESSCNLILMLSPEVDANMRA